MNADHQFRRDESDNPWHCHVRTRFSSCGWSFATFEDAIAYAKQQFGHCLNDVTRFPSYQGILSDYSAKITGPDGTNLTIWSKYWPERAS